MLVHAVLVMCVSMNSVVDTYNRYNMCVQFYDMLITWVLHM